MFEKFTFSLGFCLFAAAAHSQTSFDAMAGTGDGAYLQDARGVIARSGQGLCWRTGHWTPADAVPGCDGALIPPLTKPTAPAIVPPGSEQAPALPPSAAAIAPKRCDFAVTLDSDQTFGFNSAMLNDAAKKRIDRDVTPRLPNCGKIEIVMVTGHADRLGSHPYNQRLSEKRAEAVAAHLKNSVAEINILGAGKTMPLWACDDKLPRAQLIKCLAPNRRVTIEVRGMTR